MLFEAGAASKALELSPALVCTYLIDVGTTDVELPLAMFQGTSASREDTKRLVVTLNMAMTTPIPEERLLKLFDRFWPDLEQAISDARAMPVGHVQRRAPEELLTELVESVRSISRRLEQSAPQPEERMLRSFTESLRNAQAAANAELTRNLKSYLDGVLGRGEREVQSSTSTLTQVRVARAILETEIGDTLHIQFNVPVSVIVDAATHATSLTSFFRVVATGTAKMHIAAHFELLTPQQHDQFFHELNDIRAALGLAALDIRHSREVAEPEAEEDEDDDEADDEDE